jgi:hypothetical protein
MCVVYNHHFIIYNKDKTKVTQLGSFCNVEGYVYNIQIWLSKFKI